MNKALTRPEHHSCMSAEKVNQSTGGIVTLGPGKRVKEEGEALDTCSFPIGSHRTPGYAVEV